MKYILTIVLFIAGTVALGRGVDLDGLGGKIRNSYIDVKWTDAGHFTYVAEDEDGKSYFIVDTKSWRAEKMFDNKAFADSLNKISSGGGRSIKSSSGSIAV